MKVRKLDVWPIVKKVFPTYSGRKFSISIGGVFIAHDTNWGGGTRNYYVACPLFNNGDPLFPNVPAPHLNKIEGKEIHIPLGFVVVQHSIFCGRDNGITVHVNTQDMAKVLPNGIREIQ